MVLIVFKSTFSAARQRWSALICLRRPGRKASWFVKLRGNEFAADLPAAHSEGRRAGGSPLGRTDGMPGMRVLPSPGMHELARPLVDNSP